MTEQGLGVYKAIVAVSTDIAKTGIAKNRNNPQQGYKFRGIDDVYNEIAPLLSAHKLCILPRVLNRTVTERASKQGGVLFNVMVEMEFTFVCAEDGSQHTIKTFGEAMDSADKATNKAMSAAYKYAAFQAFCIPTEGDNDADASTPEPVAQPAPAPPPAAASPAGGVSSPPPATPTATPPKDGVTPPEADEDEGALRDHLWAVCEQIGKLYPTPAAPSTVLYDLTVNKDGKYGKYKTEDLAYQSKKKNGEWWSPLKATIKRAEAKLEELNKLDDDIPF